MRPWWRKPRANLRRTYDPVELRAGGRVLLYGPWSVYCYRHDDSAVITVRHEFAHGWVHTLICGWRSWEVLTMADKRKMAEDLVARARAKRSKGVDGARARDEELGVRCPYVHAFLAPPVEDAAGELRGGILTMWTEGHRFVVKLLDTYTSLAVYADGVTLLKALDGLEAVLAADEVPWRSVRSRGRRK
jgi:hypothetical protein